MGTRREFLRALPVAGLGLGGCSGSSSQARQDADVVAGPDSRLVFEPASLTVAAGETVTWYFDSSGHNVSGVPEHSDLVSLPEGAAPFSSYGSGERFRTVPSGETFSHTVETPGTYEYVCLPHVSAGMTGTIDVTGP